MAEPNPPCPALLLVAAFSRHEAALDWAQQRLVETFGPLVLQSPAFQFVETDYYEPTMGAGIGKKFFAFEQLVDPGGLVQWKLQTNDWEQEYGRSADHPESRPLNLDPGYLTLGKLVLASAKDFAHRIYLTEGIYAEVTLFFTQGAWEPHRWTFADYRRADYQEFFSECRQYLHDRLRGT